MTTATAQIMNQFERRPTYNELVEMIEEEELKIKPSIENVIDRKATIFRNNQYGGRFDNPDMIGLQKQEQMRQLKMLREATMREAMFNDPDRARFRPQPAPLPASQPLIGFETPQSVRDIDIDDDFMIRMNQELSEYAERQRQAREFNRRDADEMLSIVSSQELPQGVQQFMMDTPPQTPPEAYQSEPSSRSSRASGEASQGLRASGEASSSSPTEVELPPLQSMDETPPNVVEQQPASSSQIPPPLPSVEDSRIFDNVKELHPDMTMNEQLQAYRILNDVKDKTATKYAKNIKEMAQTVERLTELGIVTTSDYEEFRGLKVTLKETKGTEAKDEVREEITNWYNENVYLKYIAKKSTVKSVQSKAMARAKKAGKKLLGEALVEGGARLADSQLQGSGDVVRGVANLLG